MSPHALTLSEESLSHDSELLSRYSISSHGFVPDKTPLRTLPDAYYAPWEELITDMPVALRNGKLRNKVDSLPVLSTDRLSAEPEWRRAYVILAFLTHAYIWGGATAAERLPPQISIPILAVSSHLEVPPVATYAALNLWNFDTASTGSSFADLDALVAPHTFTGTEDESWFLMVSVAMECQGAHTVPTMLRAMEAIKRRDYPVMTSALSELRACIASAGLLLERLCERCRPDVFYSEVRPFLAGSKHMAAAGLPRGVFYDEGYGRGEWRQLRGGSNGQSSLIQFWDVVLGIEHAAGTYSRPTPHAASASATRQECAVPFHRELRDYMPGPHSRFLAHAAQRSGSLRNLANLDVPSCTEHGAFRDAYQAAVRQLEDFRNKHLQIVTRYIVIPSRNQAARTQTWEAEAREQLNLASASRGRHEKDLTGTGGTALLPLLKQSREETRRAGDLKVGVVVE